MTQWRSHGGSDDSLLTLVSAQYANGLVMRKTFTLTKQVTVENGQRIVSKCDQLTITRKPLQQQHQQEPGLHEANLKKIWGEEDTES